MKGKTDVGMCNLNRNGIDMIIIMSEWVLTHFFFYLFYELFADRLMNCEINDKIQCNCRRISQLMSWKCVGFESGHRSYHRNNILLLLI